MNSFFNPDSKAGKSRYVATAGIARPHGCLTVDEILSHFGQRKANAWEKHSEFVQAGIGNPSIWDDLRARSLLGVEGFADGRINDSWTAEFEEATFTEKPRQSIYGVPTSTLSKDSNAPPDKYLTVTDLFFSLN